MQNRDKNLEQALALSIPVFFAFSEHLKHQGFMIGGKLSLYWAD